VTSSNLLARLDAEQIEAVTCPATATIVLAAPGSGKTRVLTHRIAHRLRERTADERHVLAITFTRDAAAEMRRRLVALGVGRDGFGSPTIGTFHAVALSIVRERAASRGRPAPTIVHHRPSVMNEALANHPLSRRAREVLLEVDWAHARRVSPEGYVRAVEAERRTTSLDPEAVASAYRAYEAVKSRRGVLDLDDLLGRALDEFEGDPEFAASTRWRFRHLFLDEAQDMNPLQFEFFEAVRDGREDVFIVGDPNQAIYGWNGADPRLLGVLPDRIGRVTVLRLRSNYRSSPQIVDYAGVVGGVPDVVSRGTEGPPVRLVSCTDEHHEARVVAELVRRLGSEGTARHWGAIAVLVRTNAQVAPIADALERSGVPVRRGRTNSPRATARESASLCSGRDSLYAWAADVSAESVDEHERAVADEVREYLDLGGHADGRSFLAWTAANSRLDGDGDGVEVLTMHAAKGREWESVVIAGAEDGLLPHRASVGNPAEAEERRLAYVAVTRAARRLIVTHAARRGSRTRTRSPYFPEPTAESSPAAPPPRARASDPDAGLPEALRTWRDAHARAMRLDPRAVCSDADLARVADAGASDEVLVAVFGARTAERVGDAIRAVVAAHAARA
jgi:DNA helicase-2/ATP-dependent DNA helicase PcrA